jgi:hypothetical protein
VKQQEVKRKVPIILSREEETPTARRGVTLAPARWHPVACVRGVESYLRNLRDDRVRVVRGDVRVDVRGLMRLRLRVVRLDAV